MLPRAASHELRERGYQIKSGGGIGGAGVLDWSAGPHWLWIGVLALSAL